MTRKGKRREQNERRFPEWEELPDGGRRYIRRIEGRVSGYALYIKRVDSDENTVQLVQEIYNDDGQLIGRHQKYPDDTGHQVIDQEVNDDSDESTGS